MVQTILGLETRKWAAREDVDLLYGMYEKMPSREKYLKKENRNGENVLFPVIYKYQDEDVKRVEVNCGLKRSIPLLLPCV